MCLWLTACLANADYGDTVFACEEVSLCPSGYTCESGVCISEQASESADAGPDAAAEADADLPDALPLAACDDRFGAAPGYQLCSEDATSCSFNVNTAGGTCAEACLALESECLAAYDNEVDLCVPVEATGDTCDTPRSTEICVCAR
jgi:hypothetical protein